MVTHALVEILKSKYDGPYTSWKKIPKRTQDMWFHEFEKKFQWDPEDEQHIHENWERRGSNRLTDIFSEARENRDHKPDWIGEGIWQELWKYWDSDEFKARSQKNKKNHASDCGGLGFPLHTGGSISINDHAAILTQKLNRGPTLDELFRHTHQKKKDGNQ